MLSLIHPLTTVEVSNFKHLIPAYRSHGGFPLVHCYIVRERLTAAQFRRLPKELREMIRYPDDWSSFAEQLYRLEDPRTPKPRVPQVRPPVGPTLPVYNNVDHSDIFPSLTKPQDATERSDESEDGDDFEEAYL